VKLTQNPKSASNNIQAHTAGKMGALESSAAYILYIIIIIKERGVVRVEC
jgi:hypothetical protein